MKKTILSLLLLVVAATVSAQSLLLGDTDQNGELTIADVTKSVNMILGKTPQGAIDLATLAYEVDNTALVGTWYMGTEPVTFNADGTTDYAGVSTYEFRPVQGTLMLYDKGGEVVKVYSVLKITASGLMLAEGGSLVSFGSTKPHEYVNLGLPSGTLWATCNIGADNPEDYGDYFAWGETVPYGQEDTSNAHNYNTTSSYTKTTFNWSTYKYCSGTSYDTQTKYCNNSDYGYNGFTDTLTELELDDDAAYVNWGSNWRMPSKAQQDELRKNCTWTWTTQNGKNGYNVVGPNGNSLFLPAAGCRYSTSLDYTGSDGLYWSRTLNTSGPHYAYYLNFYSDYVGWGSGSRCYGQSVRPVRVAQ